MSRLKRFKAGESLTGTVHKYLHDKGFGFLVVDGYQGNLFFHVSQWQREAEDKTSIRCIKQAGREQASRFRFVVIQGAQGLEARNMEFLTRNIPQ